MRCDPKISPQQSRAIIALSACITHKLMTFLLDRYTARSSFLIFTITNSTKAIRVECTWSPRSLSRETCKTKFLLSINIPSTKARHTISETTHLPASCFKEILYISLRNLFRLSFIQYNIYNIPCNNNSNYKQLEVTLPSCLCLYNRLS